MASISARTSRRMPLALDLSSVSSLESPPGIAALFVIRFDVKAGYLISWKRTLPDVEVDGVVEYKSLPSGLHNVTDDLVYFIHEQYAGISAFVNRPASDTERNALMIAIGVLVPLTFGRLGKSWRHAPNLRELAEQYAQDVSNLQPLSDYWESYKLGNDNSDVPESPLDSPIGVRSRPFSERPETLRRTRAFSDAVVLETPKPSLTPFHPASSLPEFLQIFGPLAFPLYRAALLRKRILLVADAPVHQPCNYVYDLSLLASLPQSLLPVLPPKDLPPLRPRPLFNVGIHDIPYLSSFVKSKTAVSDDDSSWVACTTDSVLSMKTELYDVLVTLPPPYAKDARRNFYPTISVVYDRGVESPRTREASHSTQLKATQRDVRRYSTLHKVLRQFSREPPSSEAPEDDDEYDDDEADTASTFSSDSIVEPVSWARLAYTSFIWWASAGETRDGVSEEEEEQQIEQDARLFASVESFYRGSSSSGSRRVNPTEDAAWQQPPEIALVAYFRRWTSEIFLVLADAIARQDSNDNEEDHAAESNADHESYEHGSREECSDADILMRRQSTQACEESASLLTRNPKPAPNGGRGQNRRRLKAFNGDHSPAADYDEPPVEITMADMTAMGLDVWSATDRIFVEELVLLWWGRKALVLGARIRCCGIPVF